MTEAEVRQKVVAKMQSWIGLNEYDGSAQKIIDIYNSVKPLPRGWKMTLGQAWCATTVSAAGIDCGLLDIWPRECSCPEIVKLYQVHPFSRWEERDSYRPDPGDIVLYDWNDNGIGDCIGVPDHIGIVENVSGNLMTVIEGNMGGRVGRRNLSVDGQYIRGYCLPAYSYIANGTIPVKMEGDELDMTKAELMAVEGTGDNPSPWAKVATEWAKEKGIFNGDGNGNYGWQQPISREAVAIVLHEVAESGVLGGVSAEAIISAIKKAAEKL